MVETEQLQQPHSTDQPVTPATESPLSDKTPILIGSLLDSDTSSEEEVEAGELTEQVRREVLSYFGEKPIPKEANHCFYWLHWWKANELK